MIQLLMKRTLPQLPLAGGYKQRKDTDLTAYVSDFQRGVFA
jgi:hypothetical protein